MLIIDNIYKTKSNQITMSNKLKIHDKHGNFEKEISLTGKRSLLDEMLNEGIQIFFGCMGGSCSACKCRVIKGLENIDKEAVGEQRFTGVKEDEILTCIAKVKKNVKNETIEIEKCL